MALLCFLLDLRNIPPPLLRLLKQVPTPIHLSIGFGLRLPTLTAAAGPRSACFTSPTTTPQPPHRQAPPPPPRSPTAWPSAMSTTTPAPLPAPRPRSVSPSLPLPAAFRCCLYEWFARIEPLASNSSDCAMNFHDTQALLL
jgi:hypothetical protein